MKRNIVCIDYNDNYENKELKINQTNLEKINKDFNLVPSTMTNLKKEKGFLLILNLMDLEKVPYLENEDLTYYPNVYELDRLYRYQFKNFDYVIIINPEEYDYGLIPFSNIYLVYANNYFNEEGLIPLINKLSLEKKVIKFTHKRLDNINKLRTYFKKRKKIYYKTNEILNDLKVNQKWLQRYIKDLNYFDHNIGYNKIKRVYYIIK